MKYFLLTVFLLTACADYDVGRKAYREKNYELAKENLEPLALMYQDTRSQVELANLYLQTEPKETHGQVVRQLLHESAPVEQGKAYYLQGKIYEEGYSVHVDGLTAASFYKKANETGYWKAQFYEGRLYDRGQIVPQNYDRAEKLYETVINEHGYDTAKDDLLKLRANRAIENKNITEAEENLNKLIEMGDKKSYRKLADLYRDNILDGSKDSEIISLYIQEAENDRSGKGWYNLGRIYEEGELTSIEPNGITAYNYYKKAINKGYWRANYFIGRMYDRGTLIEQNHIWAKRYFEITLLSEEYEPARNALIKIQKKLAEDGENK